MIIGFLTVVVFVWLQYYFDWYLPDKDEKETQEKAKLPTKRKLDV